MSDSKKAAYAGPTGLAQTVHGASDGEPLQSLHSTHEQSWQITAAYTGGNILFAGGIRQSSGLEQPLHTGFSAPPAVTPTVVGFIPADTSAPGPA